MESSQYDIVVVGGGLAGLSAAAFLAKRGKRVALLEKATLGGRAITIKVKGFSFNFGAHAIYGRDSSYLKKFEKELGIHIDWRDFNPYKAKYDIGHTITDMPANVIGLFRTKMLEGLGERVMFTFQIFKTLLHMETGHPHISIGRWLEEKQVNDDIRELMLSLASSNFFTKEPEKIPSDVFFSYYRRLFVTQKAVSYIGGGWQSLISELVRVLESNGGQIFTKSKVESVETEDDRIVAVVSGENRFVADEFIFAIPPKELVKAFEGTDLQPALQQYAKYEPTCVLVYDVGLQKRIDVPYTYINDPQNKMFITDISYYDPTCVPEGGQLLQATAYLKRSDIGNKEVVEATKKKIEELYDKHFAGWREQLVVPRISQRAVVQEIQWNMNQRPMPLFLPDYRNLFFAGDWCEGQGQVSELSFSSAYESSRLILDK